MNREWTTVQLSEVCSVIKRGISPKYSDDTGVVVLNQRCIRNQRVSFENARKNDLEKKKIPLDRYVKDFDVLVNSTGVGTLGRVAQIGKVNFPLTVDSHVTIVRLDDDRLDPEFFGLAIRFRQRLIESLGEGSTGQTELSRHRLGEIEISFPNNKIEQKAIANILGKLDDKIELNRQMNQSLEDMAQALFKSWFVDFDPVIDNALLAGKEIPEALKVKVEKRLKIKESQGLQKDEGFPDSFVYSEDLGKYIPEGWEAGKLGDIFYVKGGYAFKSKCFVEEPGVPVVKIKNIKSDRSIATSELSYVTSSIANEKNDFWLETGDILMAMTGATVGKFGMLVKYEDELVVLNQRVAKFYNKFPNLKSCWFVYTFFSEKSNLEYIENTAQGSAQPNISSKEIMSTPMVISKDENILDFNKLLIPIFGKIIQNRKQIQTLTQLRETLLPQLISGKLKVPEAMLELEKAIL